MLTKKFPSPDWSAQLAFLLTAVRIAVLLCCVARAPSQISSGAVRGIVSDQNGIPLSGATILLSNTETGIERLTTTGADGRFQFMALPPAGYQVGASMPGFRAELRQGISLHVGQELSADFLLNPGSVAGEVSLVPPFSVFEAAPATASGLVDPAQLRDLPLNTRSFLELVPLQAGAASAEVGARSATQGFAAKLAIAGARYNANSFLLDGADMNDATGSSGSSANTMAGVETLREFRVVTDAYDAEFGRHSGGVIEAVTKSGGNRFHGSLFNYLRNDNLDAARWEDNARFAAAKPEYRRGQFGGSLGGPLTRKTFFFGSYEGLRESVGDTAAYIVPGPEMRAGNFITTSTSSGKIVRNSSVFLGVNPSVKPFLEAYPKANTACRADCFEGDPFWSADGTGSYVKQNDQVTNQNFWTTRLDSSISGTTTLFGRLTSDRAMRTAPAFDTAALSGSRDYYATLEASHRYSPKLLGRFHFSLVRTNLSLLDRRLDSLGLADYGLPVLNFSGSEVPGILNITGLTGWGGADSNPKLHVQNTFEMKQDLYGTAGRHSVKGGIELERFQFNQRSDLYSSGEFTFAGFDDFLQNRVSAADFVAPGADNIRGWRQNLFGAYFQDNISVRSNFTFNLGIRYEIISVPGEVNGKVATIRDLSPEHLHTVLPSQTDVGGDYFRNPSLRNFAPRLGFAWAPSKAKTFSLRGGAGIFHEQLLPNYYITSGVRMEPFYGVAELLQPDFEAKGLPIDFPNTYNSQRNLLTSGAGKPQADGIQYDLSQPMILKGNLSLQEQTGRTAGFEAGYSFARGLHLMRGGILLNTTPVVTAGDGQFIMVKQPLPNPSWNRMRWRLSDGTSWYHGLWVSLHGSIGGCFEVATSYTLSKSTDDGSSWNLPSDYDNADPGGVQRNKWWGRSAFDIHNSLSTNFVLHLGPQINKRLAAGLLGGWSLSGLVHLNSGYPITLSAARPRGGNASVQYVNGSSLDLAPGGDSNPIHPQNPDRYFDTEPFLYPAQGVKQTISSFAPALANLNGLGPAIAVGNLGRTTLTAPGSATLDMALRKRIRLEKVGDSAALEIRAEGFNILNRPNFDAPAANLFTSQGLPMASAGVIDETRGSPRQIQVAVRMEF